MKKVLKTMSKVYPENQISKDSMNQLSGGVTFTERCSVATSTAYSSGTGCDNTSICMPC